MRLESGGYVVADNYAIYGVGDTREDAMTNAKEWMDPKEDGSDVLAGIRDGVSRTLDELYVAPATAALINLVLTDGGNIAWGDWDGICCTCDEFDEAQAADR